MSKPTMTSLKAEIDNLKEIVQELKTSLRRIESWLFAGMGSIIMLLVTQMFMQEVAIDPATIGLLLTGATKAVNYLKQGIQLGKDISQMSTQVSTFMQNSSDIEHMEKRAKSPTILQSLFNSGNIEKVAVDALIAKKQMAKHRNDLKNLITMQFGPGGWSELLALEGKIRKERAEFVHKRQEQRDKIFNIIGVTFLIFTVIGFFVLIAFLWKMQRGG